ncbi:MAG: hypothetical protein M3Q29_16490 [Chloroflexota bacterium]|nr:hypothetical protein [Chloroflexota bacterium]
MSREAVGKIVSRALQEERFRALIMDRPYDAVEGYDLEPEEQGALIAGDELGLTEMGVDPETAQRYVGLFRISRAGGG